MKGERRLMNEQRLLCLLNKAKLSAEDTSEAIDLMKKVQDWDSFWNLADLNACSILTQDHFKRLQNQARASTSNTLCDNTRNLRPYEDVNRALLALHEAGIRVILLKGVLLGECVYEHPLYKKMNDWDLLIAKDQILQSTAILETLNFQKVGDVFGKHEFSDANHHLSPYLSQDGTCVLSLHWKICSPWSRFTPKEAEYFADLLPIRLKGGASAWMMQWEYNLLHLCIHMPFLKLGIRELADVSNLILHRDKLFDWNLFFIKTREWQAQAAVYRVLTLASKVIEFPFPQSELAVLRKHCSRFQLADTDKRSSDLNLVLRSRSDLIGRIERGFLLFRLSKNYTERRRALAAQWRLFLFPPSYEIDRIFLNEPSLRNWRFRNLRQRILAPLRIWQVMAKDFGHRGLLLMTLANLCDFAKASLSLPFAKKHESFFQQARFRDIKDMAKRYAI